MKIVGAPNVPANFLLPTPVLVFMILKVVINPAVRVYFHAAGADCIIL